MESNDCAFTVERLLSMAPFALQSHFECSALRVHAACLSYVLRLARFHRKEAYSVCVAEVGQKLSFLISPEGNMGATCSPVG